MAQCARNFACRFPIISKRWHTAVTATTNNNNNPGINIMGTLPIGGKGVMVGQWASVARVFELKDVEQFGRLVGDTNPLHTSIHKHEIGLDGKALALLQETGLLQSDSGTSGKDGETIKPLVHGMLVSSLFSCIFGTHIPGAIYRSQNLRFKAPVFVNDSIVARVDVIKIKKSPRGGLILSCDTKVLNHEIECVVGDATVWLPTGETI